jgi:hypothetical protein
MKTHTIQAFSLIFVISLLFSISCSSTQAVSDGEDRIDDIPEWVLTPPTDNNEFLFSTGEAESSRMNIARNRAEIAAKQELASKLGEKIEALQKLFEEEVDTDTASMYSGAFTNATQLILSQELRGVATAERRFSAKEGGGYISYVLMQMPVGSARAELERALSREEEMYIRFKESRAFEELQQNLERLGLD